jgi:DNA-binding response OmpR family regulator
MRIRLKLEKVPIIVISAYDSEDSVLKTRKLGATDFVSKPIRIEHVIEKIKNCLEK